MARDRGGAFEASRRCAMRGSTSRTHRTLGTNLTLGALSAVLTIGTSGAVSTSGSSGPGCAGCALHALDAARSLGPHRTRLIPRDQGLAAPAARLGRVDDADVAVALGEASADHAIARGDCGLGGADAAQNEEARDPPEYDLHRWPGAADLCMLGVRHWSQLPLETKAPVSPFAPRRTKGDQLFPTDQGIAYDHTGR